MDSQIVTEETQPTLVLMAGLAGAGKTTLARALRENLHWLVADKDEYKKILKKQGLCDEEAGWIAYELSFAIVCTALMKNQKVIDKQECKKVLLYADEDFKREKRLPQCELDNDQVDRMVDEILDIMALPSSAEQQLSVILDTAAFRSFILERVLGIMHSIPNAQLKVILCVVDRDLRDQRIKIRGEAYFPSPVSVDPETEHEYLKCFKHLLLEPHSIVLDTIDPLDILLTKVKDFL